MPKNIALRAAVVALLIVICVIAGIVGGIDFAPDVAMIHSFESLRAMSPDLTTLAILITQAGSAYGTIGGGLGVAAWLGWRGQRWAAAVLGTTVFAERVVVDGLKLLIDRSRPAFDLHPVVTHSSSFPSGHAGNSMAVLLSIALIAAPPRHRLAAVGSALAASFLIGATRPYLGVHWPSDLVGGWSVGAAVAIIAWTIFESRTSAAAIEQH